MITGCPCYKHYGGQYEIPHNNSHCNITAIVLSLSMIILWFREHIVSKSINYLWVRLWSEVFVLVENAVYVHLSVQHDNSLKIIIYFPCGKTSDFHFSLLLLDGNKNATLWCSKGKYFDASIYIAKLHFISFTLVKFVKLWRKTSFFFWWLHPGISCGF